MVMDKKRIISIIVMAIGLVALITGAVFLILKLNAGPAMADGEYLVSKGEWTLEEGENDCVETIDVDVETETDGEEKDASETITDGTNCEGGSGVIWKFTEIGKGTLTTNNHKNDYDFKWAMENGRLIMQTNWLYELDNEYDYTLDQGAGVLMLSDGENEYRFVAQTE